MSLIVYMRVVVLDFVSISLVKELADQIEGIEFEVPALAGEYRYASLPLCAIDAVFSISARYASTQKTVDRFCQFSGWTCFANAREGRGSGEHGVQSFISICEKIGPAEMAVSVYENRQRTSSRSGILKAEAVYLFCRALLSSGIDGFVDLDQERREFAEAIILGLPGQSSGIAFDYFMMLAGDDDLGKPDRRVQKFIGKALKLKSPPQPRQTSLLLKLTAAELRRRGLSWTSLTLDRAIWDYETPRR